MGWQSYRPAVKHFATGLQYLENTMTSKPAEENERNLSPPGIKTFKTTATEIYQYYRVNFH
jgi:hypothetical protein